MHLMRWRTAEEQSRKQTYTVATMPASAPTPMSPKPSCNNTFNDLLLRAKSSHFSKFGTGTFGCAEDVNYGDRAEEDRPRGRPKDNYDRIQQQRLQEQREKERSLEEREAYREQRRLAAKLGPKEEAQRCRAQLWLQVYFTVCPLWALRRMDQVQRSRAKLRLIFLPIVVLRRHLQRKAAARQRELRRLRGCTTHPTVSLLAQREFFSDWPEDSLQRMCLELQPVQFPAGHYIMLDGDPGGEMYFLEAGQVEVIIPLKKKARKARTRDNGVVVACLGPGAHFGEFALLNDEPRMASILCLTGVTCWTLGKAPFREEILTRPQDDRLRQRLMESANQRRRMNMRKLYPLTPQQLHRLPEFCGWTDLQLEGIIAQVLPRVAAADEVLFTEGTTTDCAYIVARGRLQLWRHTPWWQALEKPGKGGSRDGKIWDRELGQLLSEASPGEIVGEIGCVSMEPQPYTVRATCNTDLWQLPRAHWKEAMLEDASHFLQTKAVVNKKRAAWVEPLPSKTLMECPALLDAFGTSLPGLLTAVRSSLEAVVAGDGDVVAHSGLLFLVSGCLDSRKHGRLIHPGTVTGGDAPLAAGPVDDELKSIGKSEMWVLSYGSYLRLLPSRQESDLLELELPPKSSRWDLVRVGRGATPKLSRSKASTVDGAVMCGSPARTAKIIMERAVDPPPGPAAALRSSSVSSACSGSSSTAELAAFCRKVKASPLRDREPRGAQDPSSPRRSSQGTSPSYSPLQIPRTATPWDREPTATQRCPPEQYPPSGSPFASRDFTVDFTDNPSFTLEQGTLRTHRQLRGLDILPPRQKSQLSAASRTTQAMKFAAGFVAPGFSSASKFPQDTEEKPRARPERQVLRRPTSTSDKFAALTSESSFVGTPEEAGTPVSAHSPRQKAKTTTSRTMPGSMDGIAPRLQLGLRPVGDASGGRSRAATLNLRLKVSRSLVHTLSSHEESQASEPTSSLRDADSSSSATLTPDSRRSGLQRQTSAVTPRTLNPRSL